MGVGENRAEIPLRTELIGALICLALTGPAVNTLVAQERERGGNAIDDPLRGGTFVMGGVFGRAAFGSKSKLSSCSWWGAKAGHRFRPIPGNRRIRMGFRAGWEGCFSEHEEAGRVDLIYLSMTWLVGYRVARSWILYWGTGFGEFIGDTTTGTVNKVEPHFSGHIGPGLTWALGRHVLLDFTVNTLFFENFDLGNSPASGTTFLVVPKLMLALQI